jgi:hypothetical protein
VEGIEGVGIDGVNSANSVGVKRRDDGVEISIFFSFFFALAVYLR